MGDTFGILGGLDKVVRDFRASEEPCSILYISIS